MKNKQKQKKTNTDYFSIIKDNSLSVKKVNTWWEVKSLDGKIAMDENLERAISMIVSVI